MKDSSQKNVGGAYNLSRAVLAGVLAAGCLMPGFAEAAPAPALVTMLGDEITDGLITVDGTEGENPVTITAVNGEDGDTIGICWASYNDVVGYTINVNYVNSTNNMNITPKIDIRGGNVISGNAGSNTVKISNVIFADSAEIYGGYSNSDADVFSSGDNNSNSAVTRNTVTIKGTTFKKASEIYGGYTSGDGDVTGNTVTIEDTTFKNKAEIYGGYTSGYGIVTGNKVEISGNTKLESTSSPSSIYGGYSDSGNANENSVSISGDVTIKESVFGGDCSNGKANDNQVIIGGGNFGGSTYINSVYGVYGGHGYTAANGNSVSISGGNFSGVNNHNQHYCVYGGHGYTAEGNSVIISDGTFGDDTNYSNVYGGFATWVKAEGNRVIISGGNFNGNVYGGYGREENSTAKDNKVILVGKDATYPVSAEQTLIGSGHIEITGTVYGGISGRTPSGNEIHVYSSGTTVGNIDGFNTLRFFIDDTLTFGETMLTITGINNSTTDVSIPNDKLAVKVTGKPQASGDKNTIYLVHNNSGKITDFNNVPSVPVEIGRLLTGEGTVALEDDNKLVLTLNVEKSTVNENGKSLVETRAAAAFVVNNMSDFMLDTGMEQAKAAAGGVTPIDEGKLTPFAAIGGSNMRYTTGSYVDVNGWNGAVGFAKQADKLLFGVAVEHGRGNYDSYLDNGVHASGDIKSTGGVIFGEYKLDNGVHYDAALRAGRVKSDYSSTATSYDESSAYYGFSLGGGKKLTVSDKATLDVYGRYYFSHINGSDVSIATGEEIDFDAVNSHRVRIGGRYTTTLTEKSKAYAGLAWQYEFGGDAKAAINGYSAPTPSLQGHSAIVEAGYKLNAGKNLTLDFNLNGAMGKQRGIGGGIGAQWLF